MSKKKLSFEEKRSKMVEYFMETADVFTLKDLEKDCPKKKGIISQSVQEVLKSLCDDDIVSCDKIGSGNFFWAFPSQALNKRNVLRSKLNTELDELNTEIANLEKEIAELEPGREPSEEREKLDGEIAVFEQEIKECKKEIEKYGDLNPDLIRKTQRQTKVALDAANRWTDNIYAIRSYCTKKLNILPENFDKNFEIGEDFDYFE